jgi:hypothetical protein
MIMRGLWILPVLASAAFFVAPAAAQYAPGGGYPADPAAMAALQAQYEAQAQYMAWMRAQQA